MARLGFLVISLSILGVTLASAQTTTTNCTAYGNSLNCTSHTTPSLQQETDRIEAENQRSWQNLQQGIVNLRTALAERAAQKAAQEAAWTSAASARAQQDAATARENFDATTAAMERFTRDTTRPTRLPVNDIRKLDWGSLNGTESHSGARGQDNYHWIRTSRIVVTTDIAGTQIVRNDVTDEIYYKKQHILDIVSSAQLEPVSGASMITRVGRPLYPTIGPVYESSLVLGSHAFARRMTRPGYDTSMPRGTLDSRLIGLVIAAMPGSMPDSARYWVVDENGSYVQANITLLRTSKRQVPLGGPGACLDGKLKKVNREVASIAIQIGAQYSTLDVLADAPHFSVGKELKCRTYGSRAQAVAAGIEPED